MKFFVAFIVCFLINFTNAWAPKELESFDEYAQEFGLQNFTCETDKNHAIANFLKNKEKIDEHNEKFKNDCNSSFSLGLWDYSFFSQSEVKAGFNGLRHVKIEKGEEDIEGRAESKKIYMGGYYIETPKQKHFDWRDEGAVTPVRNQGKILL